MTLQPIGIASVALGVVLLFLSFAWTSVVPNEAVWTREQAIAYQDASAKLHHDVFDKELSAAGLAKSQASYDENKRRLDRAIAKKFHAPAYLRIAGLIAGGIGVGLILIQRGKA